MSSGCSRDHPLCAHRGWRGACRRGRASSRHRQWRRPCHHRQRHCSARRMISSRAGRTWPRRHRCRASHRGRICRDEAISTHFGY